MTIAFDLDDTYLANQTLFNSIQKRFKEAGHKVGIISCRDSAVPLDFVPDFEFYGNLAGSNYLPQIEYKCKIMETIGVDILFDDFAHMYPKQFVVINIL